MIDGEIVADGLDFPEGPVWLDGKLYFVEIASGRIGCGSAVGGVTRIAETSGGPLSPTHYYTYT